MPNEEPTMYQLLARQIEGGFECQDRRFEQQDRHNGRMVEELRLINGRVTEAHIKLAALDSVLASGTKRIELLSTQSHETMNRLQGFMAGGATSSFRQWLTREVTLIVTTVGLVIGALKFFGMLP